MSEWPTKEYMMENYLVWSIAFYVYDRELTGDNQYDTCCLWLKGKYASLPSWFKGIVSKELLNAGSGFSIAEEDIPCSIRDDIMKRVLNDSLWEF